MDNPCPSWLPDAYWDNVTELDKLPSFHGIMNSFEQHPRDWHLWYSSARPERALLPGAPRCLGSFVGRGRGEACMPGFPQSWEGQAGPHPWVLQGQGHG